MSHFYGIVQGGRGGTTRTGTKNSGLVTTAASWSGAIDVVLYEKDGVDMFRVIQKPWQGNGVYNVLAEGEVGRKP